MTLSDFDRSRCEGAAKIFVKPHWEPVFKMFPDFAEPIQAFQQYEARTKKATGYLYDKDNPPNEHEMYGRSLRNSISNRSKHFHPKNSGKSNGHPKASTTRYEEGRSLSVIYKTGCEKFGWMPPDEMVAHCAGITKVSFVAACREKFADQWEFTERDDGCWLATKKVQSIEIEEKMKEMMSSYIAMQAKMMEELISEMARISNGKKK